MSNASRHLSSFFSQWARHSAKQRAAAALVSLLMAGALVPAALNPDPDVPALTEAKGTLVWVGGHRYGIRFRLAGRQETFDYRSKSGELSVVRSTLIQGQGKPIAILFNAIPHESGLSDELRNDVWQLSVNGRPVRTLSEVKEAWRSNNSTVRWMIPVLLALGLYSAWQFWRVRTSASVG